MMGCVLLLSLSSSLNAQSDSSSLENLSLQQLLSTKITTASKTLQELGISPATVTVVSKEQIKVRGYQSLLDVLYDLPDVKIDDKIYSGIRNSITIRGTQGSEKFVILLDGIPISTPSGEAMPVMENYPVHLAEQVEIVFGPSSALYGANAVSGVINIITKKPSSGKDTHLEISSLVGTYGYTNTTLFLTKQLGKDVSLVLSGQYYYDKQPDYSQLYDDDSALNDGSLKSGVFNTVYGTMSPSTPVSAKFEAPMQAYNIYAGLRFQDLSISYFRTYFKLPSALGNNTSNAVYNKDVYMAQDISTASAVYKKALDKLSLTSSFIASTYNLDPRSNYRNLYTGMERGYKYSTCTMIKGEQQADYQFSEKLSVTAGAGYENYYTIPQSADLTAPVNKKSNVEGVYLGTIDEYNKNGIDAIFYVLRYHNIGTFLQTQYSPSSKLHLTLGTRYDINSRYGSSFNPRAGLVYKPWEATTIKLLYGSSFLAPTPSDSYIQYGSFETHDSGRTYHSHFLHLPNPGLKPIRSQNAELSVRQYLGDNLSVTLDGYYTVLTGLHGFADDNNTTRLYNNMFRHIPVEYVEVFINQGRQKNIGGSVQLNWKHSIGDVRLNSFASFSYVDGTIHSGTGTSVKLMELDFISPVSVHAGTDIKAGKFTVAPRLILLGKQRLPGIADETGHMARRQTLPGYALVNISARYEWNKKGSFFMNVTNALNQRYRAVGFNMDLNNSNTELFYGQPQEPIRIMAGFSITL